jgi:hypothetical protein
MPAGSIPATTVKPARPRLQSSSRKRADELPLYQRIAIDLIGECHSAALPIAEIEARFAPTFRAIPDFTKISWPAFSLAQPVLLLKPKGSRPYSVIGGFRTLALARTMFHSGADDGPLELSAIIFERLTDQEIRFIAHASVCAAAIAAQTDRTRDGNAKLFSLLEEASSAVHGRDRPIGEAIRSYARSTGQNAFRLEQVLRQQA